jgi:hypothetical protein
MFSLSLNFPKFAAASAFIALIVSGNSARADEMAQNLGPVGPDEPMITTGCSKPIIAFYLRGHVPQLAPCASKRDEMAQNLGLVGPHEPMITTVGSKRIIAFYVRGHVPQLAPCASKRDEMAQNLGLVGPHEPMITVDSASGQQALVGGSNAQDASAAGQAMERKTDGIKCVRQMPRYRPAPDFIFKC